MQEIPLAVTAVDGDTLRERQVGSVEQLSSVSPSINFGTYGGMARIAIRGVGFDLALPGSEGRVAYHLDGVYVSRPAAQTGTFYDVDRVEVLRGPQGTLYGRNATGGSINVITRSPTAEPSGYANLTIGNYGRVALEAALSGPLAEGVTFRVATMSNNRSGYGKNEYTGSDVVDDANQRGARASLRIEPTAALTIDLAADYYKESDHACALHYFGHYDPNVPLAGVRLGGHERNELRNINSEFDPTNERELDGLSGTVSLELGGATLKSITGYRHSDYRDVNDLDMTELRLSTFPYYERARQFSQELQLSGKSGPMNWLIGGYYFDEHIFEGLQATRNLLVVGGPDRLTNGYVAQGDTQTEASAVFGQADIALTSKLKLILGARYSRERISITDTFQLDFVRSYTPNASIIPLPGFPRSDSTTNNAFTPKGGVEYQLNDQTMLYATASKGFKSGGFNLGIKVPAFRPESIWSYEAGLKLTTTDRKLRANFSGFYCDYRNLQVTKIVTTQALTENAASATLYGGELELTVLPVTGVQIDGAIAYLHSAYTKFSSLDPVRPKLGVLDLKGNQLIQAPKVTANLGMQYEFPFRSGSLALRGELNYMLRIYFTAFNVDPVSQGANTKYNAFLTWARTGGNWNASLFVRNITDKITYTSGLVSSQTYGAPINGSISPPRTFGVTAGYKF